MEQLEHRDSITVAAPPEAVYALVSDITRTGEWSPVCRSAEWVEPGRTGPGARFLGHNETPDRQWTTTSTVVAAVPGEHFAWEVGAGYVRWAYRMRPVAGGTELTHEWTFLPAGQAYFEQQYGPDAPAQVAQRTASAHASIPRTLARIAELTQPRPER